MNATTSKPVTAILSRLFGGKNDPTSEEIQKEVFTARSDMELAYRRAAQLEEQAQKTLHDTFRPDISKTERDSLRHKAKNLQLEVRTQLLSAAMRENDLKLAEYMGMCVRICEKVNGSGVSNRHVGIANLAELMASAQQRIVPMLEKVNAYTAELENLFKEMEVADPATIAADKELDALYDKLNETTDPVERLKIQTEIEEKSKAFAEA